MNDENIKEILNIIERWKNGDYVLAYSFNYDRASKQNDKLLDYIINLQQKEELFEKIVYKYDELKQENERLKEYSNQLESNYDLMLKNNDNKLLMDYKSRCEKADEKIKKHLYDKKFLNNTHTSEQILNIVSNVLNGKE